LECQEFLTYNILSCLTVKYANINHWLSIVWMVCNCYAHVYRIHSIGMAIAIKKRSKSQFYL